MFNVHVLNNTVEFPTESRAANNDRIFTGKDIQL